MAEDQSVSIPESVSRMKHTLARLQRHPALSPIRTAPMIELPCCGMNVDFEAIDCLQDEPSRVYWPPRWTCDQCHHTFTVHPDEAGLVVLP